MSYYTVNITYNSETGTVVPDAGFNYSDKLNEVNEAEIHFSGTSSIKRALLTIGATVEIKRNGTREFYGWIDLIDYLDGGAVVAHIIGYEGWLGRENGAYANSPYANTASATIAAEIIAESNYLSAGTIEAGSNIDFRMALSSSLYNSLSNLARKTQQDIGIDYVNLEVDVLDHKGSATSVGTYNEGTSIRNLRYTLAYPAGNKIIVYGKGDGANQITSTDSDATSIAAYGTITRPVTDRSISSTAEADLLSAAELALTKDPTKIYDFEVITVNEALVSGDVIILNSADKDLINESVRITGIERGERNGQEILNLQVCNAAYKTLLVTRNKIISGVSKDLRDTDTFMQGSGNTNTWGSGINAKSSYPLKIGFFLPAGYIQDEAGNSNVKELTISYDIDVYKSQFGTASFDGTDPQVQNTSGNTQPDVANSSGSIGADVANSSGSIGSDVANSSGSIGAGVSGTSSKDGTISYSSSYHGGATSEQAGSVTSGGWRTLGDSGALNVSSQMLFWFFHLRNKSAESSFTIRLYSSASGDYYPSAAGAWINLESEDSAVVTIIIPEDIDGSTITLQIYPYNTSNIESSSHYQIIGKHDHADGTYAAASHSHSDGSYSAASHAHDDGTYSAASHAHDDGTYTAANHGHPDGTYDILAADLNNISIGDDVAEAGAVNAASVNLYLDFYNTGTSAWDNKHSIMATGVTIGTDVDMTNSGTYPDAAGFWRIRVEPITATADFAQGIVKIKNSVDN